MRCNFGHVVAVLLLGVIALAILGTIGPHFSNTAQVNGVDCKESFYLYQTRSKCDGQDSVVNKYDRDDFACRSAYDKITAAFGLAIAACGVGFIAFILTLITACDARVPSSIAVFFVVLTFACLAASWPLSESIRSREQCGSGASYADAGYGIDWGLACLIAGFGLAFILALISLIYGCIRPVVHVKKETTTHNIHEPALPQMNNRPAPQPVAGAYPHQQQQQPVVMLQPVVVHNQPTDHVA
jgi:hypothetical protein